MLGAQKPGKSLPVVGSPYPIDGGVGTRTLWRRVAYGGKKGRRAARRLRALKRRIARSGFVDRIIAQHHAQVTALLEPVLRFVHGRAT